MDTASEIKARVSMRQIVDRYDLKVERGGFISCPFHDERTPSLKIYEQPGKGFYCFGCGAAGSVIDFVMKLFRIGFRQAVVRIGTDFGIVITSSRLGLKEKRRWQEEQARKLRLERKRQAQINSLSAEYCRLWQDYKNNEPWSDKWCEALGKLPDIEWKLEELTCTQKTTT